MASKAGRGRRICAELSHPQVPLSARGGREDVVWPSRAASVPLAGEGQLAAGRDITTGTVWPSPQLQREEAGYNVEHQAAISFDFIPL